MGKPLYFSPTFRETGGGERKGKPEIFKGSANPSMLLKDKTIHFSRVIEFFMSKGKA